MFYQLKLSTLKLKSLFVKKPTQKLTWTTHDYELGMKWAKSVPHPHFKNKTLWDFCYDSADSVMTIHNLNKFLSSET